MKTNENKTPFNNLDGNRAFFPQDPFHSDRDEYIQEMNDLYQYYKEQYAEYNFNDGPEFR